MWLKEGFADFYETEVQVHFYQNFKDQLNFYSYVKQSSAMKKDSHNSSRSLNFYVESPKDVLDKLDDFTYYKGSSIIKMFKYAIGAETWNKGIRYYLQQNQYDSTEPKDLHKALQQAYDEDNQKNKINIGFLMRKWESQSGYPNISVTLKNGTLKLIQMNSFNKKLLYPIPITYSSPSNLNFDNLKTKFWMTTKEIEIRNFADKWIVFNNQQIGYYKVDYDENLWNGIIDQFNANHSVIHFINRIALIEMLYDNIKSGKFDAKMLFQLLKYIKHEDNIDVVEMSVNPLSILILKMYKDDKKLKSELKNLFINFYERVRHDESYNLIHSISCHLNVGNCTADAINKMILDFNNSDIKSKFNTSYCTALYHANESIVDLFYDFRKASLNFDKNATFLEDLGCIENSKLLEKSLRIYFENNNHEKFLKVVPPYIDPRHLFRWMLTDSSIEGVLNFLKNNLPKLATE